MSKKGISPLIATVLLISFVVILSGVIMFWGKQYVTELMEKKGEVASAKLDCEHVSFEVVSLSGSNLLLRNSGSVKIAGFILKYPNVDQPDQFNKVVGPAEDATIIITGGGAQVNVIPMLKPSGVGAPPVPCSTKHKLVNLI